MPDFRNKRLGTLKPGMLADFIVLSGGLVQHRSATRFPRSKCYAL